MYIISNVDVEINPQTLLAFIHSTPTQTAKSSDLFLKGEEKLVFPSAILEDRLEKQDNATTVKSDPCYCLLGLFRFSFSCMRDTRVIRLRRCLH